MWNRCSRFCNFLLNVTSRLPCEEERAQVFDNNNLSLGGLANVIRKVEKEKKRIVIMAGAGISVSAGIPDFRSEGGLYEQIKAKGFQIDRPEAVFDLHFFTEQSPMPFTMTAKEMMPGKFKPTPTHFFFRLLYEKKLLKRVFTQNIDTLEKLAGLPDDAVVFAHGSFADCHCLDCGKQMKLQEWRTIIERSEVPRCTYCTKGLVKPDIVFFGEDLPVRFFDKKRSDFSDDECGLLMVLGTSLQVQPFNTLIEDPGDLIPRVLINRDKVGKGRHRGFRFDRETNYRDLFLEGDCDDWVYKLCAELGWEKDLNKLIASTSNEDGWDYVVKNQPDEKDATKSAWM